MKWLPPSAVISQGLHHARQPAARKSGLTSRAWDVCKSGFVSERVISYQLSQMTQFLQTRVGDELGRQRNLSKHEHHRTHSNNNLHREKRPLTWLGLAPCEIEMRSIPASSCHTFLYSKRHWKEGKLLSYTVSDIPPNTVPSGIWLYTWEMLPHLTNDQTRLLEPDLLLDCCLTFCPKGQDPDCLNTALQYSQSH